MMEWNVKVKRYDDGVHVDTTHERVSASSEREAETAGLLAHLKRIQTETGEWLQPEGRQWDLIAIRCDRTVPAEVRV